MTTQINPRSSVEALSRPSLQGVIEVLRTAGRPLSAAEIAADLGRHHSGVRIHLAKLIEAGLVQTVVDEPRGRGRPLTRYVAGPSPDQQARTGHRELVRLLMGLVRQMGLGPDQVEHFATAHGRSLATPGAGMEAVRGIFESLGFAPSEFDENPPCDLVLHRCPFADGVEAPSGDLICTLHRGLATGVAQVAAPSVRVVGLDITDPRTAGCRLRFECDQPPAPTRPAPSAKRR